jgi:hypothetical protein
MAMARLLCQVELSLVKTIQLFKHTLLASDQNISDNVSTRINYESKVFDTDNCYDNATNYRFTPTVAGKYCFYVQARVSQNSGSIDQIVQSTLILRKNGTGVAQRYDNFNSHFVCFFTQNISTIVEANGTTDYFDVAVQCDVISGSVNVGGGSGGQSIFRCIQDRSITWH